ncbi:Spy/CpxP family protein refolding chaperone [Shewanella intestini]|uniref:Periplasmic heavy metal sensor n=1 Tax=Shewanella intestini TaxID=2017544 RepID=A0ABS5I3W8_9GAMM|nr:MULTISPECIES: Spy/CpxP family protein refolding chaperone [Shewanella]MBR9728719.1 hypothetical protein [Shewanella intestini]MRG36795.1 hypothetical protein [Shewanella sp. XMDDZSB0408]
MSKGLSIATAVAVLVGSSFVMSPVFAQDTAQVSPQKTEKQAKHHGKKHHSMHKMLRRLSLTDEQKTQVKAIVGKYTTTTSKEDKEAARDEHQQHIVDLVTAPSFDATQAQLIIEAHQAKSEQQMLDKLRMQNEIYNLLDAEQQEKFKKMLTKGKRRHHR